VAHAIRCAPAGTGVLHRNFFRPKFRPVLANIVLHALPQTMSRWAWTPARQSRGSHAQRRPDAARPSFPGPPRKLLRSSFVTYSLPISADRRKPQALLRGKVLKGRKRNNRGHRGLGEGPVGVASPCKRLPAATFRNGRHTVIARRKRPENF